MRAPVGWTGGGACSCEAEPNRSVSRVGVLAALLALLLVGIFGYQNNILEQRFAQTQARVDSITNQLGAHQRETLTYEELGGVRGQLEDALDSTLRRVAGLEARSQAAIHVIVGASPSIVFLQGAYGFDDANTGRPLRHLLGSDGEPVWTPTGPAMTLEGSGPVAERQFTGTAFVATANRLLVTNRHVALPWEEDESIQSLASRGLRPVMRRMVGYLPGAAEPIDVEFVSASDEADVAVLRSADIPPDLPYLELRRSPPQPGETVIVMGYPTGIHALLARAGGRLVDDLEESGDVDFWRVGRELSTRRHIKPLASGGIVGQVTDAAVVYDAATAAGGSGGPVLGLDGRVLAINAAILRNFNGSNLGVPIEPALRLLNGLLRQNGRVQS